MSQEASSNACRSVAGSCSGSSTIHSSPSRPTVLSRSVATSVPSRSNMTARIILRRPLDRVSVSERHRRHSPASCVAVGGSLIQVSLHGDLYVSLEGPGNRAAFLGFLCRLHEPHLF